MSGFRFAFCIAAAALSVILALEATAIVQNPVQNRPIDPFGLEVNVGAKTIIYVEGTANWNTAFEALTEAFKTLAEYLSKEGVKANGPSMTIYTSTDDIGFQFQAAVPIPRTPPNPPPNGVAIGRSPAGRALKFVHRGSYDAMDNTYEAITNYLDEKQLDTQDLFIEEYVTDLLKTPEPNLIINVLVPLK